MEFSISLFGEEMIKFDYIIFFKGVGVTTNQFSFEFQVNYHVIYQHPFSAIYLGILGKTTMNPIRHKVDYMVLSTNFFTEKNPSKKG